MLFRSKCLVVVAVGCFLTGCAHEVSQQPSRAASGGRVGVSVAVPGDGLTAPTLPPPPITTTRKEPAVTTTTSAASRVVPRPQQHVGGTGPTFNPSCPQPISQYRCPQLRALFDGIFGCASDWSQSVAWRESRCIPTAANREGAMGLMQLMIPLHAALFTDNGCSGNYLDARCGLLAAKRLFDLDGVRPWAA